MVHLHDVVSFLASQRIPEWLARLEVAAAATPIMGCMGNPLARQVVRSNEGEHVLTNQLKMV